MCPPIEIPGNDEREREVEDDQPESLAPEDVDPPPFEDEGRAHEAPDRARGAHGQRVG